MIDALLESWYINNRNNLLLLEAMPPEALPAVPVGMKGRSVREIFAHIYNVRLMWIEPAAPELTGNLHKLPARSQADKEALTHEVLNNALIASATLMGMVLQKGLEKGKISGFKAHPATFLGYLLAHEGYHRGEICMQLTQAGHKLPDEVLYGIWKWDE